MQRQIQETNSRNQSLQEKQEFIKNAKDKENKKRNSNFMVIKFMKIEQEAIKEDKENRKFKKVLQNKKEDFKF